MFFKTKKKRKQPAQKPKIPLSKSSGLDAFISEMKAVLVRLDKKGGKTILVNREYWQKMIDELKAIKEKL